MAVLFLLLAVVILVALAAVGFENTDPSSATLLDRSFNQLSEGQLLVLAAALGFLVALFLFLAFGASRTRRTRRKELKSRRRDAEGRVDELERENARLQHELSNTREKLDSVDRTRADAVAERDRAEATADRVRADATAPAPGRTGSTDQDDRAPMPPEPTSVSRERLDDRTASVREEHAGAADDHAQAAEHHARAADEEARRR
jgi:TolA-binding protein